MSSWWTEPTFFEKTIKDLCNRLETLIELDYPQTGGETLRSQLLSVERQLKKKDPRLEDPGPIPGLVAGTWNTFWDLHKARNYGENGPCSISYVELNSYLQLCQETLEPWEVDVIRDLDQTYLRVVGDIMVKQQN